MKVQGLGFGDTRSLDYSSYYDNKGMCTHILLGGSGGLSK